MSDYGCPFSNWNEKTMREECDLTHEPTNGAVMCDFEFDECPEYCARCASSEQRDFEEQIK